MIVYVLDNDGNLSAQRPKCAYNYALYHLKAYWQRGMGGRPLSNIGFPTGHLYIQPCLYIMLNIYRGNSGT